jgi:hypothetical protein
MGLVASISGHAQGKGSRAAHGPRAASRSDPNTQGTKAHTVQRSIGPCARWGWPGGKSPRGGRQASCDYNDIDRAGSLSSCIRQHLPSQQQQRQPHPLLPEGQKGIGQVTVALATSTAPVAEDLVCAQGTPRAGLVGRVGPRGPRRGARGEGQRAQRAPEGCPQEPRGRVHEGRDCGCQVCQLTKD